jgi:hypothetical protein
MKSAVTGALREYIQHRQQLMVTGLFGKIGYAPDYDYKARRNGRQALLPTPRHRRGQP